MVKLQIVCHVRWYLFSHLYLFETSMSDRPNILQFQTHKNVDWRLLWCSKTLIGVFWVSKTAKHSVDGGQSFQCMPCTIKRRDRRLYSELSVSMRALTFLMVASIYHCLTFLEERRDSDRKRAGIHIKKVCLCFPDATTDPFTLLKPHFPEIDRLYVVQKCESSVFEAVKPWKVRSVVADEIRVYSFSPLICKITAQNLW